MKKQIFVFESDHGPVYVEVEPESLTGDKIPASTLRDGDFVHLNRSFEDAMGNVETLYKAMAGVIRRVSPDEFNIEIGVKFNVKTGFFVLSAGSDIEFKLNLTWKPSVKPPLGG